MIEVLIFLFLVCAVGIMLTPVSVLRAWWHSRRG